MIIIIVIIPITDSIQIRTMSKPWDDFCGVDVDDNVGDGIEVKGVK